LLDTLVAYLTARELLLVIDNCEHLIDACADLAEQVLSRCPRLRLLATSREQLRIGGAVTWRVPSLASPDPRATLSPADVLLYGRQRLVTRAEPAEVRRRQASFFLAFGEQRERASNVGGPEPRAATAALDQEYPNLRLALGWSLELGEAQIGLRIARAVQYFWQARAHQGEGLTWLEVATAGVRGETQVAISVRADAFTARPIWAPGAKPNTPQGFATRTIVPAETTPASVWINIDILPSGLT